MSLTFAVVGVFVLLDRSNLIGELATLAIVITVEGQFSLVMIVVFSTAVSVAPDASSNDIGVGWGFGSRIGSDAHGEGCESSESDSEMHIGGDY
jgi:hypothetical protein